MSGVQEFYNTAMTLAWPFVLVYYLLRAHTDGKYRSSYRYRLWLDLPRLAPAPCRIWVHALSVGETLSALPLVKALKEQDARLDIVFSTATETGQAIARKSLSPWVSAFFTMPHDFPWAMQAVAHRIAPAAFILVETDVWPNLLGTLKRRGVCLALVNGRLSDRSFQRMARFKRLLAPLFGLFDLVFAQSSEDKARYEILGIPKGRVHAAGNLKFDSVPAPVEASRIDALRASAGIEASRPVWICGSTHSGEEELLLGIHRELRVARPGLLLILAPRQVDRAHQIVALCEAQGLAVARRSAGESAQGRAVYLLDTLGELSAFYAVADAAFIGGSLVPFGGHNPLEAVAQSKPVLWGPHLSNFREIESILLSAGCGLRIESAREMYKTLAAWFDEPERRAQVSASAGRLITSHSGSSHRIAQHLLRHGLKNSPCGPA